MAGKAVISLTTGLEDAEKVTVAFLVSVGAAESGPIHTHVPHERGGTARPRRRRRRSRLRRLPAAAGTHEAVRGGRWPVLRLPDLLQRQEAGRRGS